MPGSAMCRDLTKLLDLSRDDLLCVLEMAERFKREHDAGRRFDTALQGSTVALVFEKPSLRTKVSFEVASHQLGAYPVFLSSSQILASGGHERGRESIKDIAKNLERFVDIIVARVFEHSVIQEIAETIGRPVINALCNLHHPTQALADISTIKAAVRKEPAAVKVAYVGDGNNVAVSLMQACGLVGFRFCQAGPENYRIPADAIQALRATAPEARVEFTEDPLEAVKGADVVYTDTFVSMGQENDREKRLNDLARYQVNAKLLSRAPDTAIFMHCLPAHRGEEVTDEVMDSTRSRVFDQAEWRLHVAKAVLLWCSGRESART